MPITRDHPDYPHPTSEAVTTLMRANRRADTKPEQALRSELHRRGLRFRKDRLVSVGDVRVKVDIVFPRRRVAVFVDGCFWHGCPEHGHVPRANSAYWGPKLARNTARDRRTTESLTAADWRVIRLWEHTPADEAAEFAVAALREM